MSELLHQKNTDASTAPELGSAVLFFMAVVLPVFLLFIGITIDLKRYYRERDRIQTVVDQAGIVAAKKLPFQQHAHDAALLTFESAGLNPQNVEISLNTRGINLAYQQQLPLSLSLLGKVFSSELKTHAESLAVKVEGRSGLNYSNIAIYLDVGSYTAPDIAGDSHSAWGLNRCGDQDPADRKELCTHEQLSWPRAEFFRQYQQLVNLEIDGERISPRLLTQQCFNVLLSAHKELVIRLYDYFSSTAANHVAVLSGPSVTGAAMSLIQEFRSEGQSAQGYFQYYRSPFAADELCLAASESEHAHTGFQLPERSASLPVGPGREVPTGLGLSQTELSASQAAQLNTRQVIWSLAARRKYQTGDNAPAPMLPDFPALVLQAGRYVLSAGSSTGALGASQQSAAQLILVMGDYPHFQNQRIVRSPTNLKEANLHNSELLTSYINTSAARALRSALLTLRNEAQATQQKLQIFLLLTRHNGNYPASVYGADCGVETDSGIYSRICWPARADTKAINQLLEGWRADSVIDGSSLDFFLLRSTQPALALKELTAVLPLLNRSITREF